MRIWPVILSMCLAAVCVAAPAAPSEAELSAQAAAAESAKDWARAETLFEQLVAMHPSYWRYSEGLGDARLSEGKYAEALDAYGTALQILQKAQSKAADDRNAMAAIYLSEGNTYLKFRRPADAAQAYTRAAELSDKPGTAWFNLCATEYNQGDTDAALAACDKAIAADPTKADAYFIKGSLLVGSSTLDAAGKVQAPAGAAEALQMYLKLAPAGPHADDVKQMLDYLGGKH